jgi:hypothetical protein
VRSCLSCDWGEVSWPTAPFGACLFSLGGMRPSVHPCEIWDNDVERRKNDHKETTEFPMEHRGMGQTIKVG